MDFNMGSFSFLDAFPEAAVVFSGTEDVYRNAAAQALFGSEAQLRELIPGPLLLCGKNLSGSVAVGGRTLPAAASDLGGLRLVVVYPQEEPAGARPENMIRSALLSLKNGLSVFQMSTGLVRNRAEGLSDEKLIRNVEMLDHCCHRLARLVGNVEDVFIPDSGELRVSCVDLAELCEKLCDAVQCVLERKIGLEFSCGEREFLFHCDADRIERMILNLLSNSLKYTPDGGSIRLTLQKSGGCAILAVSDSGRGIPPKVLPTVFSRFGAETEPDDGEEGLGLGLRIVQKIAMQHGGTAVLESRKGRGTTVTVILHDMEEGDMLRNSLPARGEDFKIILTELSDVLPFGSYDPKFGD